MFKCATGFDLDQQELVSMSQLLSKEEREIGYEDQAAQNGQEAQCEISDTEEDDLQAVGPQQTGVALEMASQLTTIQRQTTESESEPEGQDSLENNNEPVLPSIPRQLITERDGSSGLHTSGRICRPSKRLRDDDFVYLDYYRMNKNQ